MIGFPRILFPASEIHRWLRACEMVRRSAGCFTNSLLTKSFASGEIPCQAGNSNPSCRASNIFLKSAGMLSPWKGRDRLNLKNNNQSGKREFRVGGRGKKKKRVTGSKLSPQAPTYQFETFRTCQPLIPRVLFKRSEKRWEIGIKAKAWYYLRRWASQRRIQICLVVLSHRHQLLDRFVTLSRCRFYAR